jgi:hypothetical protein
VALAVEAVDDVLEHQRHGDVGDLGHHQKAQGKEHPAPIVPQERRQRAQRAEVITGGAGQLYGAWVHDVIRVPEAVVLSQNPPHCGTVVRAGFAPDDASLGMLLNSIKN